MNGDVFDYQAFKAQQDDEWIKALPVDFYKWAVHMVYVYGMHVGFKKAIQGHQGFNLYDMQPDFSGLFLETISWYGTIQILIKHRDPQVWSPGHHRVNEYILIGRNDYPTDHLRLQAADIVEKIAGATFPGIIIERSIKVCHTPFHVLTQPFVQKGEYRIDFEPKVTICNRLGDKWVCDDCQNQFNVLADGYTVTASNTTSNESKKIQSERAKMTASLRFSILARDNFTCKACGRNPREYDVKLHVDHIHPIAKGGKTEEGNLHTLCEDCNRGKSDKTVDQMKLW